MKGLLALALLGALACELPQDPGLSVTASGTVTGTLILDANGSRAVDQGDLPLTGLPIVLTVARSGAVAAQTSTGAGGGFRFTGIPVGEYELALPPQVLGDTLEPLTASLVAIRLQAMDSLAVNLVLTYPTVTLEEARAIPPGRRIFTSGIALNARESFGDGVVHLQGESLYLRARGVARSALSIGDSVRFLGRTARDAGQPILENVNPFVLVSLAAIPRRVNVTAGEAATARGGLLDAALVTLLGAQVGDTATDATGNFRVTATDETGSVTLVFRNYVPVPKRLFDPDSAAIGSVTGLLRPEALASGVRWHLFPRVAEDLQLVPKP